MKRQDFKWTIYTLLLFISAGCASNPRAPVSRQEKIGIVVSNSIPSAMSTITDTAVRDITESLRHADPAISPQAVATATDEAVKIVEEHRKQIEERLYVLCDRLLSDQELEDLFRYYQAPANHKLPPLPDGFKTESTEAGRDLRAVMYPKISQRVLARLKREGLWQ